MCAFLSFAILCVSCIQLVRADLTFQNPPQDGVNVAEGSLTSIEWTTDWSSSDPVSLIIFQDKRGDGWASDLLLDNVPDPKSYTWVVHIIDEVGFPYCFHFNLANNASEGLNFNSGAMCIVDAASLTSATTVSSVVSSPSEYATRDPATATDNELSQLTSTSFAAPPQVSTSLAGTQSSSGLSSSAKVGLGVGLGLGIPLLLLIAGFLMIAYRRLVKNQKTVGSQPYKEERSQAQNIQTAAEKMNDRELSQTVTELPVHSSGQEASGKLRLVQRHELSGS